MSSSHFESGSSSQFGTLNDPLQTREKEKLKSDMFKIHFTKVFNEAGEVVNAKCNYCPTTKLFVYRKGYGHGTLQKHLASKHPDAIGIPTSQTQISGLPSSSPLFKYSDEKNKKELAKMIAIEHLSFSFGEKLGFTNYCQNALNPQAKRMPRRSITRELKKKYKEEKTNLITYFSTIDKKISICSDIWSDKWQVHSYMGITCHWIDNDWLLQKRLIAFRVFNERHTANNISRMINTILDEYGLCKKIFSIGFDNAAANTSSINELKSFCEPMIGGNFFHIRCACHVLNLAVQDGLKLLNDSIKPIRDAISYLWARPTVMKEWAKFCINNGKKPKRFPRDVPNRWNSTYELLEASRQYNVLLCNFFITYYSDFELHPSHWVVCEKLLDILKVFKDATCVLSGVYYPTSHLFIHEACNIVGILHEHKDDPVLAYPIKQMLDKWLNYYKTIPLTYLVAAVFDPRLKFELLEQYLVAYYACIDTFFPNDPNYIQIDLPNLMIDVRRITNEVYHDFHTTYSSDVPIDTGGSSSRSRQMITTSSSRGFFLGDTILKTNKRQRAAGTFAELESYLTTSFEFGDNSYEKDFPVLDWWKQKEKAYPILAIIAKQILAIPASTVAVEQAFSAGGSILDEQRSRLLPSTLEIQALVADWSKAAIRDQEMQQENDYNLEYESDASHSTDMSTISSTAGSSTGQPQNLEEDFEDDL